MAGGDDNDGIDDAGTDNDEEDGIESLALVSLALASLALASLALVSFLASVPDADEWDVVRDRVCVHEDESLRGWDCADVSRGWTREAVFVGVAVAAFLDRAGSGGGGIWERVLVIGRRRSGMVTGFASDASLLTGCMGVCV